MDDPVVYVSTWRIREGKFEDYRRFYAELVKIVDANEPGVPAFLAYANDDATEITNVHVYPDRATLDRHMAVLGEQMGLLPTDLTAVMEYFEPVQVQVFGTPAGQAAEMDQRLLDSGVPFASKRQYLGGFTRPPC